MIMPPITSVHLPFLMKILTKVKSGKLHQWEDKIPNSSDQDELKNFFFNFPGLPWTFEEGRKSLWCNIWGCFIYLMENVKL